ncbi:MAG TPA: SAF domain-containing protein [Solirubrobacteraceae bacterium]|nr:SAF domain-containing protein [Solirubrobacteraceae bacterium]
MIIVDRALERRAAEGRPVRVGMVGAGAMGRAIALQIATATPGMELVALYNRTRARALDAMALAGVEDPPTASTVGELERLIAARRPTLVEDPSLICAAEGIDVVLEVTGAVEFGAGVVLDAIAHGKDVVAMNAELNATLGPILKVHADRAGVVYTDADGDQPGVIMNLHRFVTGLGVTPVLLGNLKGLHDRFRNPETQAGFAARKGLTPHMAASFADGTKVSFEMGLCANATGFTVIERGMQGPDAAHVHDAQQLFDLDALLEHGRVDYLVGAEPGPGVFVLGTVEHPLQRKWLELYKLGDGPLYTFYTPYHLCHLEVPTSLARVALFKDPIVTPLGPPVVDVVATAKRDLRAGETLDGIGWFMTYGQCENVAAPGAASLLPMGLAEGCRLVRDVPVDQVLTYDDVELPPGRLCDRLRAEQSAHFGLAAAAPVTAAV